MPEIPCETAYEWDALDETRQFIVCKTVSIALKNTDLDKVRRVYELGKPKIIFDDNLRYFRVHEDSKQLMIVLTKNYLV